MGHQAPDTPRKVRRASRYMAAALAAAGMSTAIATAAQASSPTRHTAKAVSTAYRHGAVPMRGTKAASVEAACSSTNCLHYRGGTGGIGVSTGKPKIYLVFWGSQWGTQGTNGQGYATFSGDSVGVAPDLQAFFKGLGTDAERWSGILTQYCQGVSSGATSCPSTAKHIKYPKGGDLSGVWEDTSTKSPAQSTGHQLGEEAEAAAAHFGNTTATLNRNAQYVIVSPTGANPDNYKGNGFCAWHDYTGDTSLGGGSIAGPKIAFTNLPYIPDAGASCGAGFVNPGNNLDGVTIVEGHEYAETMTDQFPAGGWTANNGEENGDLCAWKTSGAGKSQNLTLATGTFAVQGTWSNLSNLGKGGCAIKHAIVT